MTAWSEDQLPAGAADRFCRPHETAVPGIHPLGHITRTGDSDHSLHVHLPVDNPRQGVDDLRNGKSCCTCGTEEEA